MATYTDASRIDAEESLAAQANSLFLQLVKKVPGVVHVEPFGGAAIGEQSFRVYVRDGDLEAERAVYQTKGRVYDRCPDAGLHVEVLEESDLPLQEPLAAGLGDLPGLAPDRCEIRPTPHPQQLGSLPSPEAKAHARAAPAV